MLVENLKSGGGLSPIIFGRLPCNSKETVDSLRKKGEEPAG